MTAWSKYRAKRTTVDGISFASRLEAQVYSTLKLMEKAGEISSLEMQTRIDPPTCKECGHKPPSVKIDFSCVNKLGKTELHEAKGIVLPRWQEFLRWYRVARPHPLSVWKQVGKRVLITEEIK